MADPEGKVDRQQVDSSLARQRHPPRMAADSAPRRRGGKLVGVNTRAAADPPPAAPLPAQSLDAFFAGVRGRAFRFAEVGLRSRDDAQDAVQDAMTRMLGYRDRPAEEWTALFWTILRSRIIDIQRRRSFRLGWMTSTDDRDGEGPEWADAAPDPSRAHDGREAWSRLAEALRGLPRRQREAFSLRVLEELDGATTARIMGCSEGSVKTHLSRARGALQKQLEEFQ